MVPGVSAHEAQDGGVVMFGYVASVNARGN
jgi:hypothetical protein